MAQVRAYVDEVIDLIDMTDRMYSLVGQPGVSGLSVEQRKRLTVSCGPLVRGARDLGMDDEAGMASAWLEPTTGRLGAAASTETRRGPHKMV